MEKLTGRITGKMAIAAVMIMATIAVTSSSVIFTQRVLAQVETPGGVSAGCETGSTLPCGVMTCPNGSTVNVGLVDIEAATDANGNLILSNSHWAYASNTTPLNLEKTGTVTHATITQSSFVLTGKEQTDTMCGTAPGATVTISGPCFTPPLPPHVGTVQFSSSNGQKATMSMSIECIPPTVSSPPPTQNTQGNNNFQGQNNNGQ